ncbi:MAG: hypothetical protein FWC41_08805 [Firmicutes bacterium]|nr:hypothetical protein [Bacillota bacterium]
MESKINYSLITQAGRTKIRVSQRIDDYFNQDSTANSLFFNKVIFKNKDYFKI